jgi:hypothetical protein
MQPSKGLHNQVVKIVVPYSPASSCIRICTVVGSRFTPAAPHIGRAQYKPYMCVCGLGPRRADPHNTPILLYYPFIRDTSHVTDKHGPTIQPGDSQELAALYR